jgi:hypothetical protein
MRIDRELDAMRVEAPATRRAHASAFQAMSKSTIPRPARGTPGGGHGGVRDGGPRRSADGRSRSVLLAQDAVEGRREALARNAAS